MTQGTITHLRPNRNDARGFGLIAPDGGGADVWFDNRGMEGSLRRVLRSLRGPFRPDAEKERPFDRLRAGQRVRFESREHPTQPHRVYAARVYLVEAEEGAAVGGHSSARVVAPGAPGNVGPAPLAGRVGAPSLTG